MLFMGAPVFPFLTQAVLGCCHQDTISGIPLSSSWKIRDVLWTLEDLVVVPSGA